MTNDTPKRMKRQSNGMIEPMGSMLTSEDAVVRRTRMPKPLQKQAYFVPGYGTVDAGDVSEVAAIIKEQEKRNGNK